MQGTTSEREDITALFHNALARICRLAVADCGLSVAELTLNLTVEVNTGVPQILRTSVVQTFGSADSRNAQCASAKGLVDVTTRCTDACHSETAVYAVPPSTADNLGVSDRFNEAETTHLNGILTSVSLAASATNTETFTHPDTSVISPHPLTGVDSSVFTTDQQETVSVERLARDSSKCDEDVGRTSALTSTCDGASENEAKADESGRVSLPNLTSSKHSVVFIDRSTLLSARQTYERSKSACGNLYEFVQFSDAPAEISSTFVDSCGFVEEAVNSTCADRKASFSGDVLRLVSNGTISGLEKESPGTGVSANAALRSQRNSYSTRAETHFGGDEDISFEEELIIDEQSQCSESHHDHTATANASLYSTNHTPDATISGEDVVSRKSLPADFFSALCPSFQATDGVDVCPYRRQSDTISVSRSPHPLRPLVDGCGPTIMTATPNVSHEAQKMGFQKILTSVSTNITPTAVSDRDEMNGGVEVMVSASVESLVDGRVKRFPCAQCDCSFSMRTNLRRHVKKSHTQPLWRPIPSVDNGSACKVAKVETRSKPSRRSSKDSAHYRHRCTVCNAAFTLRTNLTRHVRKLHGQSSSEIKLCLNPPAGSEQICSLCRLMSEQTATRLETNGLTYRHGSATFPRSLSDLGHSNDIPVVSACTVASLPAASANMNGSMETEVEKLAETSLIQDMCSGESCPTSLSEDVLSDPAAWKPDRESRVLVKHCIEIEYVHDIVIDHSALVTELEKRRTIAAELERCALENDGDFQRHRQHARWFGIVPSTLKEPRTPSSIARLRQTGDSIRNFVKMMSPATRRRHNVTTDFNSSASSLSGDTPTENGKGMSGVEFSSQGISERNSSF